MKLMVIQFLVGARGTIHKNLEKSLCELEIRVTIETIKIIAPLKSAKISRRVFEIWDLSFHQIPVKNQQLDLVWKNLWE